MTIGKVFRKLLGREDVNMGDSTSGYDGVIRVSTDGGGDDVHVGSEYIVCEDGFIIDDQIQETASANVDIQETGGHRSAGGTGMDEITIENQEQQQQHNGDGEFGCIVDDQIQETSAAPASVDIQETGGHRSAGGMDEITVENQEQQEQVVASSSSANANHGIVDFSKAFSVAFNVIRQKLWDLLAGKVSPSDFASFCNAIVAFIRMLEVVLPYALALFCKIISFFSSKQKLNTNNPTSHLCSTPTMVKVAFLLEGVSNTELVSFYFHDNTRLIIKSFSQKPWGLDAVEDFADLPPHDYSLANTETSFDSETRIFLITITGFH